MPLKELLNFDCLDKFWEDLESGALAAGDVALFTVNKWVGLIGMVSYFVFLFYRSRLKYQEVVNSKLVAKNEQKELELKAIQIKKEEAELYKIKQEQQLLNLDMVSKENNILGIKADDTAKELFIKHEKKIDGLRDNGKEG